MAATHSASARLSTSYCCNTLHVSESSHPTPVCSVQLVLLKPCSKPHRPRPHLFRRVAAAHACVRVGQVGRHAVLQAHLHDQILQHPTHQLVRCRAVGKAGQVGEGEVRLGSCQVATVQNDSTNQRARRSAGQAQGAGLHVKPTQANEGGQAVHS